MAKLVKESFGTRGEILASDNFISKTYNVDDTFYGVEVEDGRSIVKMGYPFPANDATAIGLIFDDVDVTDGAQFVPVLLEALVVEEKLPVTVVADAKGAMKQISYYKTV